MTSNNDPIANALNIAPLRIDTNNIMKVESANTTINDDYEHAKQKLYTILNLGEEALKGVVEVAQQTQQANAYVAVANMVKALTEASKDLVNLTKLKNDATGEVGKQKVTNNLFVGSTAELQKLLRKNKEDGNGRQPSEESDI